MIYKCANAYYFNTLNKIGGIESHFFYMAKQYHQYDIVFFYRTGDPNQVKRIKKYARCYRLDPQDTIICDNMFCCFNREVLNQCKAKKIYLILHGDYKDMVERGQLKYDLLPIDDRVDEYLGVSKIACDHWKELTGLNANCIYEPVIVDNKSKPLLFVSATRLTPEKGWDRMVKLAHALDENEIDYIWLIYTDAEGKQPLKHMAFMAPDINISNKLGKFDAFIQLSDNEGFCLSVVESLLNGTPVICTDLPVFKELGLNEENSIKLDLKMDDIPIDKIKNVDKMSFKYEPPKDKWLKYLNKTKSDYKGEEYVKVKVIQDYFDLELRRNAYANEIIEMEEDRALKLINMKLVKKIRKDKGEKKNED